MPCIDKDSAIRPNAESCVAIRAEKSPNSAISETTISAVRISARKILAIVIKILLDFKCARIKNTPTAQIMAKITKPKGKLHLML